MIRTLILAALVAIPVFADQNAITGAWETVLPDGSRGSMIVTDEHISIASYRTDPAEFLYTKGGVWTAGDGTIDVTYEFHTRSPEMVGDTRTMRTAISGDELQLGRVTWTRVDDSTPGRLQGAWLMTGRKRDGEISTRTPGARRTMKILSGTRFQWIAYNVETREFFGTGGGTYTTEDGTYTENIEFFSRDNSTAGRSLEFEYDLIDGSWHHQGHSTKGDPMYELWTPRKVLGL